MSLKRKFTPNAFTLTGVLEGSELLKFVVPREEMLCVTYVLSEKKTVTFPRFA